jgi:hypothetical protein
MKKTLGALLVCLFTAVPVMAQQQTIAIWQYLDTASPDTTFYVNWELAAGDTYTFNVFPGDYSNCTATVTYAYPVASQVKQAKVVLSGTGCDPGKRTSDDTFEHRVVWEVVPSGEKSFAGSIRLSGTHSTEIEIAFTGDLQCSSPCLHVDRVLNHMAYLSWGYPDYPDLLVLSGDVSSASATLAKYLNLFRLAPELFKNAALVPNRGNHDDNSTVWRQVFDKIPSTSQTPYINFAYVKGQLYWLRYSGLNVYVDWRMSQEYDITYAEALDFWDYAVSGFSSAEKALKSLFFAHYASGNWMAPTTTISNAGGTMPVMKLGGHVAYSGDVTSGIFAIDQPSTAGTNHDPDVVWMQFYPGTGDLVVHGYDVRYSTSQGVYHEEAYSYGFPFTK